MATFKISIQPSYATRALTIGVWQASTFVAEGAASVVTESNVNYATATIDLNTLVVEGVIDVVVRDDVGNIANTDVESVDASGNILPPQSNAGFDAKLDTIIADGAKEATLGVPANLTISADIANHDAKLDAHDTSVDGQLATLQTSVDAAATQVSVDAGFTAGAKEATLGTPVGLSMSADIAAIQASVNNQPEFGTEYFMTITDTLAGAGDRAGITLTQTAPP